VAVSPSVFQTTCQVSPRSSQGDKEKLANKKGDKEKLANKKDY